MSLRLRLALIVNLLLQLCLAVFVARSIESARQQVELEMRSTETLAREFAAVIGAGGTGEAKALADILRRLGRQEQVRHLDVEFMPEGKEERPAVSAPEPAGGAPRWFAAWVSPPGETLIRELPLPGGGRLQLLNDPADEVAEAWLEVRFNLLFCLGVLLLFNGLYLLMSRRWLEPVRALVATLDGIQRGDYSRRSPQMPLPELRPIAEGINRLSAALGNSKAEAERLSRKSLIIQEQERRHLAQELHDAMGQSIAAIKAMAVSIQQQGDKPQVLDSARKIEESSDIVYRSVRGMIGQLRPAVLDQLGLAAALRQMADEWNACHEAFCRLRIDGDFDQLQEFQQINVYRIVQEALTNIARHSSADLVTVELSGYEVISLTISDNGVGFDPQQVRRGRGLQGLRERVLALQGQLQLGARQHEGVSIQIEFPRRIDRRRRRGRRAGDVWSP